MKADIFTQPEEHGKPSYRMQYIHFTLRVGSWKLDTCGLHRWWSFKAAKANSKGVHAVRYGWRTIYNFN